MTSRGAKILALLVLCGITVLCVLSAFQTDQRMSTTDSLYQSETFRQFSEAEQNFFGKETDTSIVFSEKIDYSLERIQSGITNICTQLEEASYSGGKPFCWMEAFQHWKENQNMTCLNSAFYQRIKKWSIVPAQHHTLSKKE